MIFLLIGLQLPTITEQLGDIGLGAAIWYGLCISFLLIVARLLSTLGTSVFTRIMSNFITVADDNPGWRNPIIFGWAGMRGVVSLAAALSIPVFVAENQPFPFRPLILFITFIVILVTLVFQGLTLPLVIRWIKPENKFEAIPGENQEIIIQKKISMYSLKFLNEKYAGERQENEHLGNLFAQLETNLQFFDRELNHKNGNGENALQNFREIYLEMLEHQRKLLDRMNRRAEFDEDLIRKYLSLVDIEEYKLREKQLKAAETEN